MLSPINYREKTILCAHSVQTSEITSWRNGKNTWCQSSLVACCNQVLLQFLKISLCFVKCVGKVRELLSFLEKSCKILVHLTYKKNSSNTLRIFNNTYRKNLLAIIYRSPISLQEIEIYRYRPGFFKIIDYRYCRQVYLCRWERHFAGFPHSGGVDRWPATHFSRSVRGSGVHCSPYVEPFCYR